VTDQDLPQTIPGVLARAAERFGDREAFGTRSSTSAPG
jgi:hypothetical protein